MATDSTFTPLISGSGNLTQTGSGILTLPGSNTYSGNTTVSGGTLQVGNGTSGEFLASGNVSLSNGAALVFNHADALNYSGVISGNGSLTQTGPGMLTLLGSNATYSGGTIISAGMLQVGNGGTLGSLPAAGPVLDNAALLFNLSSNPTFAGVISGSGSLTQLGGGNLILTASNGYTGGTTISAGTLQLNGSGMLGPGPVADNSALVFNLSAAATYGGAIGGSGNLTQAGTNILTLLGNNTYSGSTTISAGTLQVGNGTNGEFLASPSVSLSTSSATLVFNNSDSLTYSGNIAGSGNLMQTGTGLLTLLGNNTYSGSTTISAGTLQVGNGGTAGNIPGNVFDNGTLAFNLSGNQTFAGVISGTGGLLQLSPGTLVLTASNGYSGSTTISAGTLLVSGSGSLGSGTAAVDNGTLLFNLSGNQTFAGAISGTGSLAQAGTGTILTLAGSNTYTGGTSVSAGTLQIGIGTSGEFLASPSISLSNSAALVFYNSDSLTYGGVVSGIGSLTEAGTGMLTLLGSNTYTGGTIVSAGTLQVGNGASGEFLGSPSVSLSNSAALVFNHSDPLTYSGVISGSGSLTQTGTGLLTLLGSNTYNGGTTISAGTLQVGNGGAAGSLPAGAPVLDNGLLAFNLSGNQTFAGVISGTGGLAQLGPGSLVLTASNGFSGSTTISAGTLQVSGSGSLGAGTAAADNGTLFFNLSGNQTFAGAISGTGSLALAGTGTFLTLAGSNTYTGGTTVSAGTLQVGNGTSGEFLASPSISLSNSAALVFYQSDSLTYGGVVSGTGSLTEAGTGILTLLGSNTYTGSTIVSAGTLQVGNGASGEFLGSPSVSLSNGDRAGFLSLRSADLQRCHKRQRQPDPDRHGHSDLAGQQYLQRRHDDLGRHAAGGQRRRGGQPPGGGPRARQRFAGLQPLRQPDLRRCHQRHGRPRAVEPGVLDPDCFQRLRRQHDDLRRHPAGQRQRQLGHGHGGDRQRRAAFQPHRQPNLRRRHQRHGQPGAGRSGHRSDACQQRHL